MNDNWHEQLEAGFDAVFSKMEDEHLKMTFALNMICEFCKMDSDLTMGSLHKMALFGLGYDHEEEEVADTEVTA